MFILNKVVEFHRLNLRALWFICVVEFSAIKFYPVTITLRCSNLEGRVNVRGPTFNQSSHIKHCQTPQSSYFFVVHTHSLLNPMVFFKLIPLLLTVKLQVTILNVSILPHSGHHCCRLLLFLSNSSK